MLQVLVVLWVSGAASLSPAGSMGSLRLRGRQQALKTGGVPTAPTEASPRPSPPSTAQAALLWSPGVAKRTVLAFCAVRVAGVLARRSETWSAFADEAFFVAQRALLESTHRLEWWAALSLLSSSCCVVQLALNAASLGCAGFNTVLGPLRPVFLALTAQLRVALAAAESRPGGSATLRASNTAGLVLTLVLTLAPELVALQSGARSALRRRRRCAVAAPPRSQVCLISLPSMGCVACVDAVTKALAAVPFAADYDVSIGSATVTVGPLAGSQSEEDAARQACRDDADAALRAACAGAGFEPTETTWSDAPDGSVARS